MIRYIVTVLRCLGMLWLGIIILCLMGLCDLFCGPVSPPPKKMRVVGFNCNDVIYEDLHGQTYELDQDGYFVRVGK